VAVAFSIAANSAFGDVYECVDPQGNKRFTNIKKEADEHGCKLLNVTVPNVTVPISEADRKRAEEYQRLRAATEARLTAERKARATAQIGMTMKEALSAGWGTTDRVARTKTASGTSEQWYYRRGAPGLDAYDFTNGVLTAIREER
jgi:hypothetical protein